MEHQITQKAATNMQEQIFMQSGIFEENISLEGLKTNLKIAGIDAGDLSKYTIEELKELNGRATFEIYIRGLKKYQQDVLAFNDVIPGSGLNKSGIPTWVDGSSDGERSFLLEIITRDSEPGDIGDKQLFHLAHRDGAVNMEQSARQQGAKLLLDGISTSKLEYNLLDNAIESKLSLLPETLEEFKSSSNKSAIITEIIDQLKQNATERGTTSSNAIPDIRYNKMARESIQRILESEELQKEIEKLIITRYSGTGNKYSKELSRISKLLSQIFKGG